MEAELGVLSALKESLSLTGTELMPLKITRNLKELMTYTDVRTHVVEYLKKTITDRKAEDVTEQWMKNVLSVIGIMVTQSNFETDNFLFDNESNKNSEEDTEVMKEQKKEENYVVFKKAFSSLWDLVMKWKMSPSVLKKVLLLLPDKVMHHLNKPRLMSDFLFEAFQLGGGIAVVSLHGMFVLMQVYNLEVPDFYTKLYSMFDEKVIHSKYWNRFFAYSSDFLSSTHLPEYLVASFIKRMSRLSLYAPSNVVPVLLDLMTNLMILHPNTQVLIKKKSNEVPTDPYDFTEPDPAKTRAMESYLWEVKRLQSHPLPVISGRANFIDRPLPTVEVDMDDSLNMDWEDLHQEVSKKVKRLEPTVKDHVQSNTFALRGGKLSESNPHFSTTATTSNRKY